jgi:acetylornithine deacetylase/succinyl-diaminopimelate desuccinylase-like protein
VVEVWRGEAVRLLQDLVRVPSVMEEEGAVQEVVERAFRERGLAVDKWETTAAKKLKSRPFKAAC